MSRLFPLAALALLAACGPSIKPAMQQATDTRLASYRSSVTVGAPSSYTPTPWKAGQWIAFRSVEGDKPPSLTVLKVLESGEGGFVLETETQDYYGHSITQAYYRSFPTTAEEAMDSLYKVVTKTGDEAVQTIDFATSPMGGFMKATMKHIASGVTGPTDVSDFPKESVAVAAGTFQGAAKFSAAYSFGPITRQVTAWFHPEVPLNGNVKAHDEKGWTYELVAFGNDGAVSALR